MKRILFLLALLFLGSVFLCTPAIAISFNFLGTDAGGTGSAQMEIAIDSSSLTLKLYNTSPTKLDDATGSNAPAITAFGLDFLPNVSLSSWSLTAYTSDGLGPVAVGGSSPPTLNYWKLDGDGKLEGIVDDYIWYVQNIKGGLYNPSATAGLAAVPNYFTEAILVATFSGTPVLDPNNVWSPFVRMQNVGEDGEGSLKLPVPEPATMLLMGAGLIGMAAFGRKKLFKK